MWIICGGDKSADMFNPEKIIPEIMLPEADHYEPGQRNKNRSNERHPGKTEQFFPFTLPDHKGGNRYEWYHEGDESLGETCQTNKDTARYEKAHPYPRYIFPIGEKE
jgi:hypothetical protein